jgi:glycogen debranching enzyme
MHGALLDGLHPDGTPDMTVRPNLFLAWYAAPKLFGDEEWRSFFHAALPRLWLEWGGLASVAKDDPRYRARYTGENVASYHRGDSWYYINNLAAIAMRKVDPVGFKVPIAKIRAASMHDLLSMGFCGHVSEISSAASQEAAGCWSQAWSASTLLELLLDR